MSDAEDILRLALVHEHEAVSHYTQRIRQAEAMGELALAKRCGKLWWTSRSMRLIWPPLWGLKFLAIIMEAQQSGIS